MRQFWIACLPSERHLDYFRIRDSVYSEIAKLRDFSSHFMQLLFTGGEHLEFKWPMHNDHCSMPLYSAGTHKSWVVPTDKNKTNLLRPQRPDLLFVLHPHASEQILIEGPNALERRLFRRITVAEEPLKCQMSGFASDQLFHGHLFASADKERPQEFYPVALAVDADAGNLETAAILNPVIISVDLTGSELGVAAKREENGGTATLENVENEDRVDLGTSMYRLLSACGADGGWLIVEPEMETKDDARIRILSKAQERLGGFQKQQFSRIDSLVWSTRGGSHRRKWLPFFCLDQLKGTFLIRENDADNAETNGGTNGGGPAENLWYKAYDGERKRGNEEWFAKYWFRYWDGRHVNEDFQFPQFELSANDRQSYMRRSRADSTGMFVDKLEYERQLWPSCRKFLKKLRDAPVVYDRDLITFVLSALESVADPDWQKLHQAFVDCRQQSANKVEILMDQMGFIETVSRWALMPRSQTLVEVPSSREVPPGDSPAEYQSALGGRFLDLKESVHWGGRKFAEFVHGGLWDRAGEGNLWKVPYNDGWWTSWYRGLFLERAGKRFHFSSDRGFRVGESRVGLAAIGQTGEGYRQSAYMLF
jgi:hypothetical protein